jgi:hypothetical protein
MSNMYHVTRQSIGICKLYNKNLKEFEFQKLTIYLFALFFLQSLLQNITCFMN